MSRPRKHVPEHSLNLAVRGLSVSATLAIQERSAELRRQGREIYRLGLGQSPFPVPSCVVEKLQANAYQKDYLPVRGLVQLRAAVAEYYRKRTQHHCSEADVLVGPGSKELMFLLQLVYYGDLLVSSPSWVSYAPQARIAGRTIQWIDTRLDENWNPLPERVSNLCREDPNRPRILILNYPNNPTGRTLKSDELRALAQVAREYGVLLLSDEIYGEIHHLGKHVSVARYYPEGTIISGGLSKWCGAGGWRLGVFVFPPDLRWLLDAMAVVASETYTSTSAPIQYAAVRAYQGGLAIERYLWTCRSLLRALGRYACRHLAAMGAAVAPPQGAFYLFPDFSVHREALEARGIRTGYEMCEALLQGTGVALLPGSEFGRPAEELTARLAYVDFDGARALAAVERLPEGVNPDEEFLQAYCSGVVTALERMKEWFAQNGVQAGGEGACSEEEAS